MTELARLAGLMRSNHQPPSFKPKLGVDHPAKAPHSLTLFLRGQVNYRSNKDFRGLNPDVSIAAHNIQVSGTGNADSYIPRANGESGLHFTLNVSGPNGSPSYDEVTLTLFGKDSGNKAFIGVSWGRTGDKLREVAIRPSAVPGQYVLEASVRTPDGTQTTELDVQVLPCPRGSVTSGNNDTCITCGADLYSFDPTTREACSICGTNFQCPGGDVVWPEPKYWHSAPYSIQMHRCANPNACIGGAGANKRADTEADFKSAQCSGAYQGNLCGECKEGFGRVRPFFCRKCMPTGTIVALYMLAVVVMIGLVKLLVFFQTAGDNAPRTDLQRPIPAEMLRPLVIHTQWLYIICSIVGIPWPTAVSAPMQAIVGIWSTTSGSSIGFDCIFQNKGLPVGGGHGERRVCRA